jgi:hypothetical protein
MAYDGTYRSMSDGEKQQTVEGIRDYYRRLPDREKSSFREAMAKSFEVSDRTVYRYLKEDGTNFLGKRTAGRLPGEEKDIRARFSKGVLEPDIRKGVPKKETTFEDKNGNVNWSKFRKTLSNDGIWKNLKGRIQFQINANMRFVPFVIFEVYNSDDDEEEVFL